MTAVVKTGAPRVAELRDYFAAHAPPCPDEFKVRKVLTIIENGSGTFSESMQPEPPEQRESRWRWTYADQMMRTR